MHGEDGGRGWGGRKQEVARAARCQSAREISHRYCLKGRLVPTLADPPVGRKPAFSLLPARCAGTDGGIYTSSEQRTTYIGGMRGNMCVYGWEEEVGAKNSKKIDEDEQRYNNSHAPLPPLKKIKS